MSYKIMETDHFVHQLHQFDKDIFAKWQHIGQKFYDDPFDRSLQPEKIEDAAQDNVYSARLDQNYRVIFRHIKPDTILLFLAGTHDNVYAQAKRLKAYIEKGRIRIVETTIESAGQGQSSPHLAQPLPPEPGLLFNRWSDIELLRLGLTQEELADIRSVNTEDQLLDYNEHKPVSAFSKLFELLHPPCPPPPLPLFTLPGAPKKLVGRDAERDALERCLVYEPYPIICLEGTSGLGKTALAEGLYQEAWALGYKARFLSCKGQDITVDRLLANLSEEASDHQQVMMRGLYPLEDRLPVALEFLNSQPTLLVLDDYDALSEPSSIDEFVRVALRHHGSLRVVLTALELPACLNDLEGQIRRISLKKLSLKHFSELIEGIDPRAGLRPAQIQHIWEKYEGNPGRWIRFHSRIREEIEDEQMDGLAFNVQDWLNEMLTDRARSLAERLSVVGTGLTYELMHALFPQDTYVAMIGELVSNQVLRELSPGTFLMDDSARSFLYELVDASLRRDTHRAAGLYFAAQASQTQNNAQRGSLLFDALHHLARTSDMVTEIRRLGPEAYDLLSTLGDWGRAHTVATAIVNAARQQQDRNSAREWLLRMAIRQIALERFTDVESYLAEAMANLPIRETDGVPDQAQDWSRCKAQILIQQGRLAYHQATHDYKLAATCYHEALDLAQHIHDELVQANCLLRIGQVERRTKDWAAALEHFSQACAIAEQLAGRPENGQEGLLDAQELVFECTSHLGVIARKENRIEDAYKLHQSADKIAQAMGDSYKHEVCLSHMGRLAAHPLLKQSAKIKAEEFLREALTIARQLHSIRGIRIELTRLIDVLISLQEYDEAEELLKESEQRNQEAGDDLGIAWNHKHRGQLMHAHGDFDAGNELILQGIEEIKERHPEYIDEFRAVLVDG